MNQAYYAKLALVILLGLVAIVAFLTWVGNNDGDLSGNNDVCYSLQTGEQVSC